jgi:hypothetical protein
LEQLGEDDPKRSAEKLYYFLRLRYWAGARITADNRWCFAVHPLLDHALVGSLFHIAHHEKQGARFQKGVIRALCPGMLSVPFGDEEEAAASRGMVSAGQIGAWLGIVKARLWSGGTRLLRGRLMALCADGRLERHFVEHRVIADAETERFLGLRLDQLANRNALGRYMTVLRVLRRHRDKIFYDASK